MDKAQVRFLRRDYEKHTLDELRMLLDGMAVFAKSADELGNLANKQAKIAESDFPMNAPEWGIVRVTDQLVDQQFQSSVITVVGEICIRSELSAKEFLALEEYPGLFKDITPEVLDAWIDVVKN